MQRAARSMLSRVPAALLRQQRQSTKSSFAGDSLSVAALAHAVSRYNLEPFLPSFEVRNLSTLIHIAGVTGYAPHPRRSKSYVLTDAVYRAEQTCEIWQRLTSPHLESL